MNLFKLIAVFFRNLGKKLISSSTTPVYVPTSDFAVVHPPSIVPPSVVTPPKENRVILYEKALTFIGTDASPDDKAPDELGCAETISDILYAAFLDNVGFPGTLSTTQLYRQLSSCEKYERVSAPLPGDIVISPSGYGNGNLSNGHVGIKGPEESILSNSSSTGTFISNYTMESWRLRYVVKGGFPMVFFRRK